ncbi:hypothetical protein D7X48_09255 [bacterium D16-50]|jgi:hypothetical protein|nr:hypothetical protein [Lachnospiraceae bacterium]RKJ20302.1 hypothetical protein D7X48_09255 [bacterium D16-50]
MKRWLGILSGLICCALCSFSVRADMIWEPQDSFYERHEKECEYVNRQFTANGPDGMVIVYKSPELPEIVDTWENGHRVSIIFTYRDSDGILWGIYDDYRGKCGWVPMDYMSVVYDDISFRDEYEGEIEIRKGQLDDKYLGTEVYFWSYPGGDAYILMKLSEYTPEYGETFVDEEGNVWGGVGYYYGIKNNWICIDKPDASFQELYPEGGPRRGRGSDSGEEEWGSGTKTDGDRIVPKGDSRAMTVTLAMVALVVSVTAVLLRILKGRGERKGLEK